MNTVEIWPLFSAIFLLVAAFFAYKPGGLIDQIRDWRHGRAVDQTVEWEAFTAAFKDEE